MGFSITSDSEDRYTQIPNSFICDHMPSANGNFVKLYLHLMMVYQHQAADGLTVSMLADCMECTENDILRALHYWQREGLMKLQEEEGTLLGITLCRPGTKEMETVSPYPLPVEKPAEEFAVPDKQEYTPLQSEALMKDAEIDRAVNAVEQLLGEPVSPAHLQTILYFMCDVGFSAALLTALYETAVQKGKKRPSYIEAIGISWAKKGIRTAEEAKEESAAFSGKYSVAAKAFGIHRSLAPAEREIIDSWDPYHFSEDIIEEACRRTILQTGDANFNYASRILENWHKKNVTTLQDIEQCDASHKRQKRNTGTGKKVVVTQNQFQSFPQRSYSQKDFNSLERQLLQSQRN